MAAIAVDESAGGAARMPERGVGTPSFYGSLGVELSRLDSKVLAIGSKVTRVRFPVDAA